MTVAIYGFVLALMAVMKFAPGSPLGLALNRQLVEAPLRRLGRIERHHLIFVVIIAALAIAGSEMILAIGSVDLAVVYALDLSLYVDGLLMTLALASMARTRSGLTAIRAGTASVAARLRRRFSRRQRRSAPAKQAARKPSNDDHPAFAVAA